jgi:hypothetical protein
MKQDSMKLPTRVRLASPGARVPTRPRGGRRWWRFVPRADGEAAHRDVVGCFGEGLKVRRGRDGISHKEIVS